MGSPTTPEQHPRRTPLRPALEKLGARWLSIGDAAVADGLIFKKVRRKTISQRNYFIVLQAMSDNVRVRTH